MDLSTLSTKQIGNLGEAVACEYLKRHGHTIAAKNYVKKTGEIDVIALEGETLHFVEVKTVLSDDFPTSTYVGRDEYDPSINIHEWKLRKIARTAEWYVAEKEWEGEWQVDAALVWLRRSDGRAKVSYLAQII